jgi:tungstate transport system substrate-binding protein
MADIQAYFRMMHRLIISAVIAIIFFSLCGCPPAQETPDEQPDGQTTEAQQTAVIKLATTTSVDNSGLLIHILPVFTAETGIEVDVIAVGTGAALEMGRKGDVDIVLVHSPKAEQQFIDEGFGVERYYVAQNEFVIVGPGIDPLGIRNVDTAVEAFTLLLSGEVPFISRGDNSGTHKRELSIWDLVGETPEGDWYIESGQGMGAVLTIADELEAYTLTDSGTYYSMVDHLDLVLLLIADPELENIYSILPLNPEVHPDLKHDEAMELVNWITGPTSIDLINDYEVNTHRLFTVANR